MEEFENFKKNPKKSRKIAQASFPLNEILGVVDRSRSLNKNWRSTSSNTNKLNRERKIDTQAASGSRSRQHIGTLKQRSRLSTAKHRRNLILPSKGKSSKDVTLTNFDNTLPHLVKGGRLNNDTSTSAQVSSDLLTKYRKRNYVIGRAD